MIKSALKQTILTLIFCATTSGVVYADFNDFFWDVTGDVVGTVGSELIKGAMSNKPRTVELKKSQIEINRLSNIVSNLKNNNSYSEDKIKDLESKVEYLQNTIDDIRSNSPNIQNRLNHINKSYLSLKNGKWFVILGSYSASDIDKANKRKKLIESEGFYGVAIYNTNNYPNLTKNLNFVNFGPLSKEYALRVKNKLLKVVPDAYIKSGW